MRTYKKRLPEGQKVAFGASHGVKIRIVNKNLAKKNKNDKTK
jgi:hypothetical protein